MVDDEVDTAEMVDGLYDVIHVDSIISDADGVGLEDVTSLVVGQSTTLHVVRIVGQVYLGTMIDAALQS